MAFRISSLLLFVVVAIMKMKTESLSNRLVLIISGTTAILCLLMGTFTYLMQRYMLIEQEETRLEEALQSRLAELSKQMEEREKEIQTGMNLLELLLEAAGGIQELDEQADLTAVHQHTGNTLQVSLPIWSVAETSLHDSDEAAHALVDKVLQVSGVNASILQRFSEGYVRISANSVDGRRPLYSYLPEAHPVAMAVSKGKTYTGKANLIGEMYLTMYRPIIKDRQVIGMLATGLRDKYLHNLSASAASGQTQLFLIDSVGSFIHSSSFMADSTLAAYLLSNRDGSYRGPGPLDGQEVLARFQYHAPSQYYVVVATPLSSITQNMHLALRRLIFISIVAILLAALVSVGIGRVIMRRIRFVSERLRLLAQGETVEKTDTGPMHEIGQMQRALNALIDGLAAYTDFAYRIGKGDFSASFHLLGPNDRLGKALFTMRDSLAEKVVQDERNSWIAHGVAKFSDLLRVEYETLQDFGNALISALVRHLGYNQGAIFIATESNEGVMQLELKGHYAYERLKYRKVIIAPGEGLVGQCFLEKEPTFIQAVPNDHLYIRSGLGEAPPKRIYVLPLVATGTAYGVIELASFQDIPEHHRHFLEKIAENIALELASIRNREYTRQLLQEANQYSSRLQAQEEELRQNMEESQATQEEMRRQSHQSKTFTDAVDRCSIIIDFDHTGTIVHVNPLFEQVTGFAYSDIVGRKHTHYVPPEVVQSGAFEQLWADLSKGKHFVREVLRMKKNGERFWLRASYMPIFEGGQLKRISCICFDITADKKKEAETQAELEKLRQQLMGKQDT